MKEIIFKIRKKMSLTTKNRSDSDQLKTNDVQYAVVNKSKPKTSRNRNKVLSMIELFDQSNSVKAADARPKDKKPAVPPKPKVLSSSNHSIVQIENGAFVNSPILGDRNTITNLTYWHTTEDSVPRSQNAGNKEDIPKTNGNGIPKFSKTVKNRINNFENLHKDKTFHKLPENNQNIKNDKERPKKINPNEVNPIPKPRRIFVSNSKEEKHLDKNKNNISPGKTTFNNHSYLSHLYSTDGNSLPNQHINPNQQIIDNHQVYYSEVQENGNGNKNPTLIIINYIVNDIH